MYYLINRQECSIHIEVINDPNQHYIFLNNFNFRSSCFSMGEQMMNKMKNSRMAWCLDRLFFSRDECWFG